MSQLQPTIEEYLNDYNAESKQPMPLVMFMDAIGHVARITRVLRQLRIKHEELELAPHLRSRVQMPGLSLVFTNEFERFEAEVGEAPKKVVVRGNPVATRTKETKGNPILGLVRIDLQTGSHASLWFVTFFAGSSRAELA